MQRSLKCAVAAAAMLFLTACDTVPASVTRVPELGGQAVAGVGDAVYRYQSNASKVIDYMSGATHAQGRDVTQELLYSGLSSGELQMTYREFVDDLARPAFSQEARYQYAPGIQLTFKGATLRVLSADNSRITYMVERGFTDEAAQTPAAN